MLKKKREAIPLPEHRQRPGRWRRCVRRPGAQHAERSATSCLSRRTSRNCDEGAKNHIFKSCPQVGTSCGWQCAKEYAWLARANTSFVLLFGFLQRLLQRDYSKSHDWRSIYIRREREREKEVQRTWRIDQWYLRWFLASSELLCFFLFYLSLSLVSA